MTTQTTKKRSLLEASADIFNANRSAKQATGDAFGAGSTLNNPLTSPTIVDLGPAHIKSSEPFVDFTKGVPSATPPGKTPPVGAEEKKILGTQPAQTAGEKQAPWEQLPDQNYKSMSTGAETPGHETVKPGQGNIPMPWAHESFVVSPEDLEDFLEEAKKLDPKTDAKGKKDWMNSWKSKRKSANKANSKADRKTVREGLDDVLAQSKDYQEDIDAIFSDETLSEEFKTKASTVFEAAVTSRVREVTDILETVFVSAMDERVEEIRLALEGRVNDYLDYMVKEWIAENEIAIEKGLRAEIVEDFIGGLRNLFLEHYIDIPEEKVDLVSELSEKVAELEAQLSSQVAKNIDVSKELGESKKSEAIRKICEGMTDTQVEKMKSLAEGVDYTTATEFVEKVKSIKESYYPTVKVKTPSRDVLNEDTVIITETKSIADPLMRSAMRILSDKQ